jgi:hypothetical protein
MIEEVLIGSTAMSLAQTSLDVACSDLDDAVRCLSDIEGETIMANQDLVALLFRVVTARRHLKDVERPMSAAPPASMR